MYPNIEAKLGLHQELVIRYEVDSYRAILYKDDNCDTLIMEDTGISISDALDNLNIALDES